VTETPAAIVGLELDGRGFDSVNAKLNTHLQGWERVEATTNRIGSHLSGIASKVGMIAAGFGVGAVIGDFLKLEDAASRAALAVGAVGGEKSYGPFRDAYRAAGIATSMNSVQLAGAVGGVMGQLGGAGMTAPMQGAMAMSFGHYSRSYGIDVGALAASGGQLGMFQKAPTLAVPGMLGQIAAQARAGGNVAQTGQWLQAITGATSMLGSMHPAATGPGLSGRMGAMYGAVSGQNPVFRDPGMFSQGLAGIDQASTSAYSNPRLQAAYQMAGVGYWQQRGGLAGKGGVDMARKMLAWSERSYGKGSIEQDLFLRSNFGDVSADMLKAFGEGEITYDQLQATKDSPEQQNEIQKRSESDQTTPNARRQKIQEDAGDKVDGPLADLLAALGIDSIEEAITMFGAAFVAKKMATKGGAAVFRALKTRGGRKAAEKAAAVAAGGKAGGLLGKVGKFGKFGRFALKGGVVTTAAGILLDPGDLADEDKMLINQRTKRLREKFGDDWASNQDAREYAVKQFNLHGYQGTVAKTIGEMFDKGGTVNTGKSGGRAGADPVSKLSEAAEKLSKAADKLERAANGGRARGASNDPQGHGGSASSQEGTQMVLASFMGALTGTEAAVAAIPGLGNAAGGGGGSSAAAAVPGAGNAAGGSGGGAWKACTLTWYDPALGGTNSGTGRKDPNHPMANGQPYSASARTCAAPKGYAFGDRIEFKYGRKTVVCTVTDRGGAINGSHFDLNRGAASAISMIAAGSVKAQFRKVGSAPKATNARAASASGGGGARGGAGNDAAWLAGAGAASAGGGGGGGGAGGVQVHVNIDGRKTESTKRLVRG
jgi:hypothetical protein